MKRVRVAVVDPSHFFRQAVEHLLRLDSRFECVGTTDSGTELLNKLPEWRPKLVTLALQLKDMSGLELLDHLVGKQRATTIIVDKLTSSKRLDHVEALHRGAVDVIDTSVLKLADYNSLQTGLIDRIAQLSQANVNLKNLSEPIGFPRVSADITTSGLFRRIDRRLNRAPHELLLIGASTGGPSAIQSILENMDQALRVPCVIVQHMPNGFTQAFAERLNEHLSADVQEALDGEHLQKGRVYVAPAGYHVRIERSGENGFRSVLSQEPSSISHRPSVDELFASVASDPEIAKRSIALLLTGMGTDGAVGMHRLEKQGAHTIAQDQSSCVVFGMPAAALQLKAACEVLPLAHIGERLIELISKNS